MTENNKLSTTNGGVPAKRRTFGLVGLQARVHQAASQPEDATTRANRIALMLDCSGSMRGDKIVLLRDAMQSFVTNCNLRDTSLALETFPERSRVPLTTVQPFIMTSIMSLQADGGTPMAEAMRYVLSTYSVTRCVLVSDGIADFAAGAIDCAGNYAEAGTPIDCVHIGTNTDGESVLQQIAERTGGKFIKFTDVANFAKNFKYLTPAFYGQLTSGAVTAAQLGAKEIK